MHPRTLERLARAGSRSCAEGGPRWPSRVDPPVRPTGDQGGSGWPSSSPPPPPGRRYGRRRATVPSDAETATTMAPPLGPPGRREGRSPREPARGDRSRRRPAGDSGWSPFCRPPCCRRWPTALPPSTVPCRRRPPCRRRTPCRRRPCRRRPPWRADGCRAAGRRAAGMSDSGPPTAVPTAAPPPAALPPFKTAACCPTTAGRPAAASLAGS